ncbi:DNA-3-methyladenine glycosylase family protein [Methylobacterium sp. J-090]|uniref:DNA-3-methyladenine glycosylase family protein n=1 Tax=Methylobacterium sp. J-090 TaxID=2836666 RepID=UPI001FBB44D7|nr:AlkA N-terminal domain-containing protein [Methylobacterium sp. J-090]MCJ2083397.1 DNA-3-methyladenine glycosylase 2 family protein [Methylobacterium sp. J-090]
MTPIRLPYTPPYDWPALRDYLAARAIPGVEAVTRLAYRRTIDLSGRHGHVAVGPGPNDALVATIHHPDPEAVPAIRARLAPMFDCDADPMAIRAGLAGDPHLARLVAARPGLRVPGAWDGFELAVRAILGQQVSVAAATRLAGRLVATFGTPLAADASAPGLSHVFPAPERLAEADIAAALGMPCARGEAIRTLSAAVAEAPGLLAPGREPEAAIAALTRLRGIGDWTAQYIALRALRAPDALPAGDLALLRALDDGGGRPSPAGLAARSRAWRPWRSYAVLHLWTSEADRGGIRPQEPGCAAAPKAPG